MTLVDKDEEGWDLDSALQASSPLETQSTDEDLLDYDIDWHEVLEAVEPPWNSATNYSGLDDKHLSD